MILNEDEVVYGFINENNTLINFAIFKKNDFETLERVKNEFNAFAAHEMDLTKELAIIDEAYWSGTRFLWPSPFLSWIFNDEANLWEAPVPHPNDGKSYIWDEDQQNWTEILVSE